MASTDIEYLQKHKVATQTDEVLRRLLAQKPDQPIDFVLEELIKLYSSEISVESSARIVDTLQYRTGAGKIRRMPPTADAPAGGSLAIGVVLGSVRPGRAAERVGKFLEREINKRGHTVVVVDPMALSLPMVSKPYHFYKEGEERPVVLDELHAALLECDGYIVACPEYNNVPAPALLNVLDYFPPQANGPMGHKPTAICCYSAGSFGGVRTSPVLRNFMFELGSPTIPNIFPISKVYEALDADGNPASDQWVARCDKMAAQLEWYSYAMKARKPLGPPTPSPSAAGSLRFVCVWGSCRPGRTCERIGRYIQEEFGKRGHTISNADPTKLDLPLLQRAYHAYSDADKRPAVLNELFQLFQDSDGIILLEAEYNHTPTPALLNVLDHLSPNSAAYANKACGLVSYSAGPFGGLRARLGLTSTVGELGLVTSPVALTVPAAHNSFDRQGIPTSDVAGWQGRMEKFATTLEYYALAFKEQGKK